MRIKQMIILVLIGFLLSPMVSQARSQCDLLYQQGVKVHRELIQFEKKAKKTIQLTRDTQMALMALKKAAEKGNFTAAETKKFTESAKKVIAALEADEMVDKGAIKIPEGTSLIEYCDAGVKAVVQLRINLGKLIGLLAEKQGAGIPKAKRFIRSLINTGKFHGADLKKLKNMIGILNKQKALVERFKKISMTLAAEASGE